MPVYELTSPKTGKTWDVDFDGDPKEADMAEAVAFFDGEFYKQQGLDPSISEQGPVGTAGNAFARDIGGAALDAVGGVAKGAAESRRALGPLGEVLRFIPGGAALMEFGNVGDKVADFTDRVREEGRSVYPTNPANKTAETIGGGAGQAVAILGTAGAAAPVMGTTAALTVVPTVLGGAMGLGSGIDTAKDLGIESPMGRLAVGGAFAGAEALTERLGGIGGKAASEAIQQGVKATMKQGAKSVLSEAIEEPISGSLQDAATFAAGKFVEDKNRPGYTVTGEKLPALDAAFLERRKQEAIGGAAGGTVFAGLQMLPNGAPVDAQNSGQPAATEAPTPKVTTIQSKTTGKSYEVEFEGEPTQADLDEAAAYFDAQDNEDTAWQRPLTVLSTSTPENESAVFSTDKTDGPARDKKALKDAGYPPAETLKFLEDHYDPSMYDDLAGEDVVWLALPSTTGINPLPSLLAQRLATDHGGVAVVDAFEAGHLTEAKNKRGYLPKMREPSVVAMNNPNLPAELQGKRVVLVDDILTSGETVDSARAAMESVGIQPQAVAVMAAVKGGSLANNSQVTELATELSKVTGTPMSKIRDHIRLAHGGARGKFILEALKEARASEANAREIHDIITRKAESLRPPVSGGASVPATGQDIQPGGVSGQGTTAGVSPLAQSDKGSTGPGKPPSGSSAGTVGTPQGGGPGASSLNEWGKTRFGERLRADDRLRQAWRESMAPNQYRKETWEEWQERANGFIAEYGIEGAYALLQDPDSPLSISDRPFLGMQLILSIDKATRQAEAANDTARAEMLDDLNHELQQQVDAMAHKAGLELSTFAAWTRMSADGVLRSFERKLDEAREKDMGAKIGKPEDIAAKVKAEADDQRETVTSEALGESALEQLAEMQRKIAELRQQLEQAKAEAEAAKQATAQAQTPAEAAQAEQAVEKTKRKVESAKRTLKDAEARQKEKAKQAGKPRPPGEKKPRVINPADIVQRMIQRLSETPDQREARVKKSKTAVRQLADDYTAGKIDAAAFELGLKQLGITPEQTATLKKLLDVDRAAKSAPGQDAAKKVSNPDQLAWNWIDKMTFKHLIGGPTAPQQAGALAQAIRDYLKADATALPDLFEQALALGVPAPVAVELQRMLDMERKSIAQIAQERAIQNLVKQITPKTALPKTRQNIPRFLKKLMEAHELGALDRAEFLDAYAEAFDLPQMDKAQRDRVAALIQKQRDAPEGWMKQQATTELMDELAKFKGISAFDTWTAFWYANILSGISTQGVNLTGSAWHLGLRTLSVMGSHHPELTWHFFRGMFRGAQRGLLEAVATLRDGSVPYKGNLQFTQGQVLELVHTNDAGRFRDRVFQQMKTVITGGEGDYSRAKAFAAFGKIVFRALAAGDAFFYHSAREAKAGLEAARYARDQVAVNGGSFASYLAEQLNHGQTQYETALEQAKQETKDAGMTPKSGDLERRALEILDAARPAELTEAANRFGLWVTYTHRPEGTMGQIADVINQAHRNFTVATPFGEVRLLTPVIPFVNIIANVTDSALDFTPVGIARGLRGKHLHGAKGEAEFTPWEARQRLIAGTMGTMGVGMLWMLAESLADGNDDEVPFMIYGMGPSTKARREQMPKGWKPYTVKIGDTYWSYSETPLAIALSVAGGFLDKKRYGSSTAPVAAGGYIMSIFGGAMLKTGMLSSVDDIFSMLSGEKPMTPVVTRTVTGLIPAQGLLREISELMHGEKIDDTTLAAAFFKDIPIVRSWAGKAPLNVFGEPVKLDLMQRLPVVKRLVTLQGEDPETLWLARQKLWIPGMDNQIAVGSYLPEKVQQSLQQARMDKVGSMAANVLSHEERYRLVQLAGPEIRRVVKAVRAEVEKNPDVPREYIQNYLNGRIVGARRVAMMELLGLK